MRTKTGEVKGYNIMTEGNRNDAVPKPTPWRGWWLMILMTWDTILRR